ncbi:MAG: alanine racemase, partial [Thermomicrobiaceae bacterium]|nr:alanine racemase [Thermomicrobiaceae bacterium]
AGLRALGERLGAGQPPLRLHLKVDTGMHRFGVEPEGALALARAILADPRFALEGLYTHFATADEADTTFLDEQLRRFGAVRRALREAGIDPPLVHAANSPAALRGRAAALGRDLDDAPVVRAGLALYGLAPSPAVPLPVGFRPALRLETRVGRVFTLAPGEGVSYGLTYVAERPVRCATLPVGYGDGLPRQLSSQGWVVVRGVRCPILGRVCMDQTVVDVSAAGEVAEGDAAVVLGDGRDGAMTPDEVARLCGTINYEVVTALAARVPRVYLRGGRPVAVSDLLGTVEG